MDITQQDTRTIKHCRKSLLFYNNEPWKKGATHDSFDVTMGSFDGAEICEIMGLYILCLLTELITKDDIGLYRDDGLLLLRNANGIKTEKTRKEIINIFKNIGFQIEITTNLK